MATLLLFHHALGLTPGCLALAATLRAAGHVVHTPDLYEGHTFASLAEGIAYAEQVGFETVRERGRRAAEGLPADVVYAGLSLGVLPAQLLAQTRPGARGAVLLHACVPPEALGSPWPAGVPVQVHLMADDPLAVNEGDLEAAQALAESVAEAELFLYPGDRHLFADAGLPDYDAEATALLTRRVLDFLARVG